MATVKNQWVPPSLLKAYSNLFTSPKKDTATGRIVAVQRNVKKALRRRQPSDLSKCQLDAARWLVTQWKPVNASQFYEDRLVELKTNVYDEKYWYILESIRDRTERGVPLIYGYERPVNGQYNDPLRIQSNCVYEHWSSIYNTPLDAGTVNQPAPGWQGTVIDQIWRDTWFAQRRLIFKLPFLVKKGDGIPILMGLKSEISALASFRGNHIWFGRCLWPYFFYEGSVIAIPVNYLMSKWNKADIDDIELINTREDCWQCTNTKTVYRNARLSHAESKFNNNNRLGIIVTTPPSRGVYSARNDNVSVTHHETLNIYVGRGPNG
ncbi:MAG: hypothetical protein RLZ75_2171 [Pseudomonadota bacterium]|jgi:hypothetical protein